MKSTVELEENVNLSSIISLLTTALIAIISYTVAALIGKKCSRNDRLVVFWFTVDALTHFSLEFLFLVLSLTSTVGGSQHWTAELWKEYGKADKRWMSFDATVVSIELITVFLAGPLCLAVIYAIVYKRYYRHWLQITVCVAELYGGWMTFAPEWITGCPNLDTSNWIYLWVYLTFFNCIWVVVPALLLYQSWVAMQVAFTAQDGSGSSVQKRGKVSADGAAKSPRYSQRAGSSKKGQ